MNTYYVRHRNPNTGGGWRLLSTTPFTADSLEAACSYAIPEDDLLWQLRKHGPPHSLRDGTPAKPYKACGGVQEVCAIPADLGDTAAECEARLAELLREHRILQRDCGILEP